MIESGFVFLCLWNKFQSRLYEKEINVGPGLHQLRTAAVEPKQLLVLHSSMLLCYAISCVSSRFSPHIRTSCRTCLLNFPAFLSRGSSKFLPTWQSRPPLPPSFPFTSLPSGSFRHCPASSRLCLCCLHGLCSGCGSWSQQKVVGVGGGGRLWLGTGRVLPCRRLQCVAAAGVATWRPVKWRRARFKHIWFESPGFFSFSFFLVVCSSQAS